MKEHVLARVRWSPMCEVGGGWIARPSTLSRARGFGARVRQAELNGTMVEWAGEFDILRVCVLCVCMSLNAFSLRFILF